MSENQKPNNNKEQNNNNKEQDNNKEQNNKETDNEEKKKGGTPGSKTPAAVVTEARVLVKVGSLVLPVLVLFICLLYYGLKEDKNNAQFIAFYSIGCILSLAVLVLSIVVYYYSKTDVFQPRYLLLKWFLFALAALCFVATDRSNFSCD